ncbi:hypothetical protein IVB22_39245 [Bradyrhizobium sp. 190]|uniref:hypothetical protein n=1 Tax=Bradyrhizobium sp. 190 TaxID=2782658 RepID=UPI001FFBE149|nr:hypothetical protein [Bradyrhizobium sp. 190]MCK1518406.1 hypothetical protein [Bradyrhizobium sp. 190]
MSAALTSYLVEILLPKETGHGKHIGQGWFEDLLTELTKKFGGATSFIRAPGHGLWRSNGTTKSDNIAIIEVMTDQLEPEYWKDLRERLERELSREEVVIRAQEIRRL